MLLISPLDTWWKENHFYLLSTMNVYLLKFWGHQFEVNKNKFLFSFLLKNRNVISKLWLHLIVPARSVAVQDVCVTMQKTFTQSPHQLSWAPACLVEYIFMIKSLTEKVQLLVNPIPWVSTKMSFRYLW